MSKSYTEELRSKIANPLHASMRESTARVLENREALIKAMTGCTWENASRSERADIFMAGVFLVPILGVLLGILIGLPLCLLGIMLTAQQGPSATTAVIQIVAPLSVAAGIALAALIFWYKNLRPKPEAARLRLCDDASLVARFEKFRAMQERLTEAFAVAKFQAQETGWWTNYYDRLYR